MKRIISTFLEAIHGAPRDYTQGSVSQAVILLGIPMVLEMLMESVFAVTDIFFVGSIGANAVATIGLTESLMTIVYTVAFGLSIGVTALMARRVGEGDLEGASNTAVQTVLLGIIVSVLIAIAGLIWGPSLLLIMGGSAETVAYGLGYLRVMFGGNIVILLLFLGNAVFRGAGDGTIAMRALWLANGLNVILVPCFVKGLLFFPELGVMGAALATTLSRGIGAIYVIAHLWIGIGRIKVGRRHFHPDLDLIGRILRLSGAGTVQVFIGMASWIGMVRVISTFGEPAVAGYTIGFRIVIFAIMPAFGLANAAATMVGQSLGAKLPDRAERAVWLAGFYNTVFLGIMGILFLIFAPSIVGWFTTEPLVNVYAISCLRTISSGFLFYAFGMVITQSFNGAGDTWTPTLIHLVCFWFFELPMSYLLSITFGFGPWGAFFAVTLAFSAMAGISTIVFRSGHWKVVKV